VPLYTVDDAERALHYFQAVAYDTVVHIGDLTATLIASGHIPGAAFVVLSDGAQKLTFTGDLGNFDQLIMKSPPYLTETDFLVVESTYGNRIHEAENPTDELKTIINESVKRGGKLIIPAFAVARAQTILYCLYQLQQQKALPAIPIFLDSPMAIEVTELFCKFSDEHKLSPDICKAAFGIATYTRTSDESKALAELAGPAIIIAGSGMADGGRVVHHLANGIDDPKNTVLFVGFQALGTLGRRIVEGAKEVKIYGAWHEVHAKIRSIKSFSAHADYREILEWLSHFTTKPKRVFVTHGELEAAETLKGKIEARFHWSVVVPKYRESFEL
jgi:metallo-beta-lactamase family protein